MTSGRQSAMLSAIASELQSGAFVLLGTEPWLHLNYGIVSLNGRPTTRYAQALFEFVVEAERTASVNEAVLAARFGREQVVRFEAIDSHDPERGARAVPTGGPVHGRAPGIAGCRRSRSVGPRRRHPRGPRRPPPWRRTRAHAADW